MEPLSLLCKLTAVRDDTGVAGLVVVVDPLVLDFPDHVQAVSYPAELYVR